ncbi:MAG: 2Fe-2S iron-sulfur cluster binding domain-containing protein [Alphaproteobacteria bacterium]|nr:2Fe-2S iron-sulfur cluster binding domain-containing protein [Alphaproteobacteria bacterium]MDE2042092.1 2Fe-2S iron-sulfur cluster binding domain-containing protein [Alphaproteobacteria bacterium]MDE2341757.1 2Fe-2S iron-sulfur cluster binding domain-containing protein [Alphaproteobacteria bacterium]
MPSVTYIAADGTQHVLDVPLGENVMRGALYNDIEGIVGECGGALSCATCHCYVDEAWAAMVGQPASKDEDDLLEGVSSPRKATSRLSCQIVMTAELDGLVVHMPDHQY